MLFDRPKLVASVLVLAACVLPSSVHAQMCGEQWLPAGGFPQQGASGVCCQTVWDPDGPGPLAFRMVIAGGFDIEGLPPAHNIAAWNGSSWSALGDGVEGLVWAIAALPNGDLCVAESYTSPQGLEIHRVRRWDGAAWSTLGAEMDDIITALIVLPGGDLIAGGYFRLAGGEEMNGAARWDGSAWTALSPEWETGIEAMALTPSGDLIIGGVISQDGIGDFAVARWTGTTWVQLGDYFDSYMWALCVTPSGDVIAGGEFVYIGSTFVQGIARWDGAAWTPMGSGLGTVFALDVLPSGDVVAGGFPFSPAGGHPIALWDGVSWTGLGLELDRHNVFAIDNAPDGGGLIASGNWDPPGLPWTATAFLSHRTQTGAPWVSVDPEPAALNENATLTLAATPANGYSNVTYQWFRDGAPIEDGPGGASLGGGSVSGSSGTLASPTSNSPATLTITGVRVSDAGAYTAVFENACGSATSKPAAVSVLCLADYDANTFVNGDDFDSFVLDFELGLPGADVDHNGFVNGDDFDGFAAAFEAGC